MRSVAPYRGVPLSPLKPALAGSPESAQSRWIAWLQKQRLDTAAPPEFAKVPEVVRPFCRALISNEPTVSTWNPFEETSSSTR